MKARTLGHPDLKVSVLGFGGWPMGGTQYGATRDDQEVDAIHAALDAGITLFDTAAGYGLGHSEELMGRALNGHWADVVVVTKCGIVFDHDANVFRRDSRGATITAACVDSLRRLGADHIDVFLIHWPDFDTPIEETMRAMEQLVETGKVRFVGVSNFSPDLLDQARAVFPIVTDQVGYHLLDRRREADVIPYCRASGVGIMAYGSLAHGVLSGAFGPETTFAETDWRHAGYAFGLPLFHPDHFSANLEAVESLRPLADSAGLSLPQLAIRWVLREPAVATALVGFRNAEEVRSGVAAIEAEVPNELLERASAITKPAYERMGRDELPFERIGPRRRVES